MLISSGSDVSISRSPSVCACSLLFPFPEWELARAWDWLQEYPERNFDDYGPKDCEAFVYEMRRRAQREWTWGVIYEGALCGIIGYLPITRRVGTFHGICFAKSTWGVVPEPAVRLVLADLYQSGTEKVCASFFADNTRVHNFFRKLGALDEGILRKQTLRNGVPIDMQQVALFKEDYDAH